MLPLPLPLHLNVRVFFFFFFVQIDDCLLAASGKKGKKGRG
jgi:hypothetical protein